MKEKERFINLSSVLAKQALYNLLIGERSNGKTFAVLEHALTEYWKNGSELAYIRRWADDFKQKRGAELFSSLEAKGKISKITGGVWTTTHYYSGKWFLARYNEEGKKELSEKPFAYAFALTAMEHDKSISFPNIRTIVFDEFLTRNGYLPNEFVLFMNTLSTIIRERDDVKIFMCGNTVNVYAPYFKEMGITNIKNMKQGDIDVYEYGSSGLRVAVYFTDGVKGGKKSDVYFAFNNPHLSMITGKGSIWELDIYPHLPVKYVPRQVLFIYFIAFDGELLQCDVVQDKSAIFTYIHRKTTPLKKPEKDLIFTLQHSHLPNWRRNIKTPPDTLGKKIYSMYVQDKIFYQDNEVGEIVRNYLMACKSA